MRKESLGKLSVFDKQVLLKIMSFVKPTDFFSLRVVCTAFKALVDDGFWDWEPENLKDAKYKTFNISRPKVGSTYNLCSQIGEHRWPGDIQLALCRKADNVIELKRENSSEQFILQNELKGHNSPITFLRSITKTAFASGDQTGRVIIWQQHEKTYIPMVLDGHAAPISGVVRTPDNLIYTSDKDGVLKKWNLSSCTELTPIESCQHESSIVGLKLVSGDTLQVVGVQENDKKYPVHYYDLNLKLLDTPKILIPFGLMVSDYSLEKVFVYQNGNTSSIRLDKTNLPNSGGYHTIWVMSSALQPSGEFSFPSRTQLICEKRLGEWSSYNTSVFSNSNFMFWNAKGDAYLGIPKRLPVLGLSRALTPQPQVCDTEEQECDESNLVY